VINVVRYEKPLKITIALFADLALEKVRILQKKLARGCPKRIKGNIIQRKLARG
jgi:hypothetical protein